MSPLTDTSEERESGASRAGEGVTLSCCDHTFLSLEHTQACELIRLLGFDSLCLAIWSEFAHLRPEELYKDPVAWAGRLDERVRSLGLDITDVFLIPAADYATMAVNHPSRTERERGREVFVGILALLNLLGVDGITLLPGVEFEHTSHSESLKLAAEELTERVRLGLAAGVRVSIEPHVGSISATPRDVERLIDSVVDLELTLDHSHFTMQGIEQRRLEHLYPRVRHVHARASRLDELQTRLQDNEIDFAQIVSKLRRSGYRGSIALEYLCIKSVDLNNLDTLSETVGLRDLLRSLLLNDWSDQLDTSMSVAPSG